MKRILGVLAIVALVAMTVQAVEVQSQNVAGVYTVIVPGDGSFNLVSLNLDPFDPLDQTLSGVFGDQLRAGASPALADKLLIYDPATLGYDRYGRKLSDGLYHSLTNWNIDSGPFAIYIGPFEVFQYNGLYVFM